MSKDFNDYLKPLLLITEKSFIASILNNFWLIVTVIINNTLWLHELQGNTQILKNNRQVTKSVNPLHQAVWTLGELYQSLETWAYSIYDNRFNSSLGQSPFQAYETGIQLGGKREIRHLEYDQTFLILTLPSPQSGDTRIVQPGRGVKVNHIYYWCHAFRDPEVEKTAVEVKNDPGQKQQMVIARKHMGGPH